MTLPLRIAAVVFNIALFVALLSGWYVVWFPSMGQRESISHTFLSALLVILVTGLYIAISAALASIQRNSNRTSNRPTDE